VRVEVEAAPPRDALQPPILWPDGHAAEGVVNVVPLHEHTLSWPGGAQAEQRGADLVGGREVDGWQVLGRDEGIDGQAGDGGGVHDRAVRRRRGARQPFLLDWREEVGDEGRVRPRPVDVRDVDQATGGEGLGEEGVDDGGVGVGGGVVVAV
jgi:hypothetical protein